ncbi:MAG: hypothetical protein WDN45_18965 [Caulobacteraceae bacterium]
MTAGAVAQDRRAAYASIAQYAVALVTAQGSDTVFSPDRRHGHAPEPGRGHPARPSGRLLPAASRPP